MKTLATIRLDNAEQSIGEIVYGDADGRIYCDGIDITPNPNAISEEQARLDIIAMYANNPDFELEMVEEN